MSTDPTVDEVIAELNRIWYERTGRPVLKPDDPDERKERAA